MGKYKLGLELGETHIKILECKRQGRDLLITKAKRILTPKGAILDGVIIDLEEVSRAIGVEIRKRNYKAKTIVAVIKSSQVITRNIKMDKMPPKDLEAILETEYQDHLLVDIEAYQVRYKKLEKIWEEDKKEDDLLIVAASNAIIDPLMKLAKKLKMRVEAINIASDAITKLFTQEENVMVVDLDENATTLTIISGEHGILSKVIPFGSNSQLALLMQELEEKIQRLIQFYMSRNKHNRIEKIYIIGETHYLNTIDRQISELLRIPSQLGLELETFKGYEQIQEERGCFANILGLMSQIMDQTACPINLLPRAYGQAFKRKAYIGAGLVGAILGLISLSFLTYLPLRQIRKMEVKHVYLDKKLSHQVFVNLRNAMENISISQKEKEAISLTLDEITTSSNVSKKTMDVIITNAPEGVEINHIVMDRALNTIALGGSAQNVASMAQYIVILDSLEQFQEITYTTSHKHEEASNWEIDYQIEIQLIPLKEAEEVETIDKET